MMTLSQVLRAMGLRQPHGAEDDSQPGDELRLYLARLNSPRVWVGSLRRADGEYIFEYSKEFAGAHLPPVPDFPTIDQQYRSAELWPFFLVRMPPADRPDIRSLLSDRGLTQATTLQILAALGKRVVSSPYELELAT